MFRHLASSTGRWAVVPVLQLTCCPSIKRELAENITKPFRRVAETQCLIVYCSFSLAGRPIPLRLPAVRRPHLPPALLGDIRPARPLTEQLEHEHRLHHPPGLRLRIRGRRGRSLWRRRRRRRRRVWNGEERLQDSSSLDCGRFGNK